MADNARLTAFRVLTALENRNVKLDSLITQNISSNASLAHRDRSFAKELAYGVTRWKKTLDAYIIQASNTPFEKIDITVLTLLRLGVYQSYFLSRTPVSAAINETVNTAKKDKKSKNFTGFINAVLRGLIKEFDPEKRTPEEILACLRKDNKDDAAEDISWRHSYPLWMTKRWVGTFGEEEAERIAIRGNERAPVFIRRNPLAGSEEDLFNTLSKDDVTVEKSLLSADCYKVTSGKITPESSVITKGLAQPQDASSQIASGLLDPGPGDSVADLCCGQGIKSGAFASMMKNRGAVFSFDNSLIKIELLKKNMGRLGAVIIRPAVADLVAGVPFKTRFNKIFLDAPCSATGIIRRHPDVKWNRDEKSVERMAQAQKRMLESAFGALAPGGRLVYSVCSIEPEEGFRLVNRFLADTPGAGRINVADGRPELLPFMSEDGDLFILPGDGGMDGFFASIISRIQ